VINEFGQCSSCHQYVRPTNSLEMSVQKSILNVHDWWEWDGAADGYECCGVRLFASDTSYSFEYADNPVFMIFEIGGAFYRKDGVKSSYGECDWSGRFREVRPVSATERAWEEI
jgi:hypothetical protein